MWIVIYLVFHLLCGVLLVYPMLYADEWWDLEEERRSGAYTEAEMRISRRRTVGLVLYITVFIPAPLNVVLAFFCTGFAATGFRWRP